MDTDATAALVVKTFSVLLIWASRTELLWPPALAKIAIVILPLIAAPVPFETSIVTTPCIAEPATIDLGSVDLAIVGTVVCGAVMVCANGCDVLAALALSPL